MRAELCPVCRGSGRYVVKETIGLFTTAKPKIIKDDPCHGCKDKEGVSRGWVMVPEWNPPQREIVQPPLKPYRDVPPLPLKPYEPRPYEPLHIGDRNIFPFDPFNPRRRPLKRQNPKYKIWPLRTGDGIPISHDTTFCII